MIYRVTVKEDLMPMGSLVLGPLLAPFKAAYLTRRYYKLLPSSLTTEVEAKILTLDNRDWQMRDVRRALLIEIGLAFGEIVPLLGGLIRQGHDMQGSSWFANRQIRKTNATDVFFGFKANRALQIADQLLDPHDRREDSERGRSSPATGDQSGRSYLQSLV